jgi:hypothetical protein
MSFNIPFLYLQSKTLELTEFVPLAIVTLTPVNYPDTVDRRILKFESAFDTIDVGRSSRTEGKQLEPGTDNAWFSSRVISRTHAKIWANPHEKVHIRITS